MVLLFTKQEDQTYICHVYSFRHSNNKIIDLSTLVKNSDSRYLRKKLFIQSHFTLLNLSIRLINQYNGRIEGSNKKGRIFYDVRYLFCQTFVLYKKGSWLVSSKIYIFLILFTV